MPTTRTSSPAGPTRSGCGSRVVSRRTPRTSTTRRRAAAIGVSTSATNSIRLLVARWVRADAGAHRPRPRPRADPPGAGRRPDGQARARGARSDGRRARQFSRRARALRVERVRLSATSAVRDAVNREELAQAVLRWTGEPMEVLSGEEEARTTYLGATRGLENGVPGAEAPYLVLDIGGGSTEFVLGAADGPEAAISMDVGSVRLTERRVASDPPNFDELRSRGRGDHRRAAPGGGPDPRPRRPHARRRRRHVHDGPGDRPEPCRVRPGPDPSVVALPRRRRTRPPAARRHDDRRAPRDPVDDPGPRGRDHRRCRRSWSR